MKYMTFNSSCSFAGIANMLEYENIDVEDYQIAIGMKLPYIMYSDVNGYYSGAMLQEKKWFNIYLYQIGYEINEDTVSKKDVYDYLLNKKTAMLGIKMPNGTKHAINYIGFNTDSLIFLNNRKKSSNEESRLILSKDELESRVDDRCIIATLIKSSNEKTDMRKILLNSLQTINGFKEKLFNYCKEEHTFIEIKKMMNSFFRAIFLDNVTALQLIGEDEIANKFLIAQKEFLGIVLSEQPTKIVLADKISMGILNLAIEEWKILIKTELEKTENCI